MKKRIIIATVTCLFLILGTVISVFGSYDYCIRLGNDIIMMKYPSFMQNDRIYVSVRSLCDELGIPIYWDDKKNEVHIDIYNKQIQTSDKTLFKKEGVIPDAETALVVGKAILEKYVEKPLEYEEEDKIYYLEIEYLEQQNAWKICQTFSYKDENKGWSVGGNFYRPYVVISKQTAEVLYINTHSSF